jgi:RNA polymerase-binding protein DksA
MRTHRIRRLVVVDDEGALAGILALDDVLALLAEEMTKVGHLLAEGTSDRTPREIASPVWAKTETVQPIGRADLDRQFRAAMRRRLRERREAIFRVVADAEDDLRFIAEDRESEPEERAQEEVSAQLLARLDERGRRAIEEIDGALARLAEGAYGTCVACKHRIGYARLQAVPATTLCADCAREAEVERAGSETLSQHYPGHLAPDLALLSDREVERAVFDALREDGRVEMQELRIVWRHGILHADGALPSEGEHRIFRAIVLDVLGIEELDDHVCIDERLFEGRPSPGGARVLPPDVASTIGRPRPAGEEEGNEVLLPAGPVPDAE